VVWGSCRTERRDELQFMDIYNSFDTLTFIISLFLKISAKMSVTMLITFELDLRAIRQFYNVN